MRRAILIAISCVLIMNPMKALARSADTVFSGAQLLDASTRKDQNWIGFCNGYLQAAHDVAGGEGICAPKGVTRNDFFDKVIPILQQSRELQKMDAVVAVVGILRRVYPCNEDRGG
jgi:hypothetical protein